MSARRLDRVAIVAVVVGLLAASAVTLAAPDASAQAVNPANLGSPLTSMFLDGEAGSTVTAGHSYTFTSPTGGHSGAAVTFTVDEASHAFNVSFAPITGESLIVGTYTNAMLAADATHPGLSLSGDSANCSTATGTFSVDQVTLDGSGNPLTFSARFEFHCNGETPAVFGAVSYNGTADYRTTTIPTTINFGSLAAGQSSAWQPLTVTNNGPSDLTVEGAFPAPAAGHFAWTSGTCGVHLVLHSGQSCSFNVSFQPQQNDPPGRQTANFRIFDELAPNSGSGRHVQVTGSVSGWQSLGGSVNADPSSVTDPANPAGVYAFVRGGDNALYFQHSPDGVTWSGFTPGGGSLSSLPFAVTDAAGVSGAVGVYVFGRGADGALYAGRIIGGVWQGWQPLGGSLTSLASAAATSTGVWVAVRGGDGALYARHLSGGIWSPWQSYGGYLNSAPWLAADASGVHAFVAGGGDALYERNISAATGWVPLGGLLTFTPIAVADATGIGVYVRGGDGAVYTRHLSSGTWTPYQFLGGYITSVAFPVAEPTGVSLFARGGDGNLYRNHFNGTSWGGWSSVAPYVFESDALAVADSNSFEHVFVIGPDLALHTIGIDAANGLSATSVPTSDMRSKGNDVPLPDSMSLLVRPS